MFGKAVSKGFSDENTIKTGFIEIKSAEEIPKCIAKGISKEFATWLYQRIT